jgi:uncharacterized glyoxalase superfamily protein PhnB
MHPNAASQGSTAIPCLRYRDAPAMIAWLCQAFGFEKRLVVDAGDGKIAHAQLTLGAGMIMVGSERASEFDRYMTTPAAVGGKETQSCYVVVDDADAVLARASAEGAEVVVPIADQDYGGRLFTCRDPEGHLWSVGSYDPWAE